jgi:hypothetical protein
MMSQEFSGGTPEAVDATLPLALPAARKLSDCEMLRLLCRVGFGVDDEARHLQRAVCVALKTLLTNHDAQMSESVRDAGRQPVKRLIGLCMVDFIRPCS